MASETDPYGNIYHRYDKKSVIQERVIKINFKLCMII